MNTWTLAAALAAVLFPVSGFAQDDPRLQDLDSTVDHATRDAEEADPAASGNYPWGQPELPPPADPDPAPADPRVPTVEELDDPMVTPPVPDVPPPVDDRVPMESSERWSQLDADGDGRITAEEGRIDADFHSSFEMMDANSDGFVDRTELDGSASGEDRDDAATGEEDAADER